MKFQAVFLGYVEGIPGHVPLPFEGEIGEDATRVVATPTSDFTPDRLVIEERSSRKIEVCEIAVNGTVLTMQGDPIPGIVFSNNSGGIRFASPKCPAGKEIVLTVREASFKPA